jgi:hypothetical protein
MPSRHHPPRPLHGALLLLALLVAVRVGMEARDWWAHGPDRREFAAQRQELVRAGHQLIVERARADTLRRVIESHDARLAAQVEQLDRFGRRATDGLLPHHLYPSYREVLAEYEDEVVRRNEEYERWMDVYASYQEQLERYRTLAESLLHTAGRIGEEYPSIPSPAEAYAEVVEAEGRRP